MKRTPFKSSKAVEINQVEPEEDRIIVRTKQAAQYLNVSVKTMERFRSGALSDGPPCIRYSDGPTSPYYYRMGDLRRFVERRSYANVGHWMDQYSTRKYQSTSDKKVVPKRYHEEK